jgi:hypothetical protein
VLCVLKKVLTEHEATLLDAGSGSSRLSPISRERVAA